MPASATPMIAIFPPPPVNGLGTIGGFKLQVEDRTDQGDAALNQGHGRDPGARPRKTPGAGRRCSPISISACRSSTPISTAPRRMQLGVDVQDVFDTMQTYLGSIYVNDFNRFGRTYEVIAQADTPFRAKPDDILRLQVRNASGQMVPLGAVVNVERNHRARQRHALQRLSQRRSQRRARRRAIRPARRRPRSPKSSTRRCPRACSYEWTDLTYQQILAGNTALLVFPHLRAARLPGARRAI